MPSKRLLGLLGPGAAHVVSVHVCQRFERVSGSCSAPRIEKQVRTFLWKQFYGLPTCALLWVVLSCHSCVHSLRGRSNFFPLCVCLKNKPWSGPLSERHFFPTSVRENRSPDPTYKVTGAPAWARSDTRTLMDDSSGGGT